MFLNISKAFDKVWHKGLIFKLKQNGISGKFLHFIKEFLSDRKQVVLNGWKGCLSRSPSKFYTFTFILFFLIYVKNLPDNLTSNSKLFTNNKLFSAVTDSNASANQYQ